MSLDNFKKRMLSDEYEEDDFFLPSDAVWSGVEKELDDQSKRRKPYMIFFSSFILLIALVSLMIPKSTGVTSHNDSPKTVPNSGILYSEDIANSKKSIPEIEDDIEEGTPITFANDYSVKSRKKYYFPQIPKRPFRFIIAGENLKTADFYQSTVKYENTLFNDYSSKNLVGKNDFTLKNFSQNESKRLSANLFKDWTSKSELDTKIKNHMTKGLIHIDQISSLSSYVTVEENNISISPTLVLLQKPSPVRDFKIGTHVYSSISNYSISDFSGFQQVEFDLKANVSFAYQVIIEKNISNSTSIYAGVGLDHAHFDANYLLSVEASQLDFSTTGPNENSAKFSKTIPSLAGGLESSFVFNNFSSDINQAEVKLSLAHDFKTLTFPIGARFSAVNNKKIKASLAVGVEYTKRLLTIDTGVNTLSSDNGDIELKAVSALEIENQPFRVHNLNATASVALDYQFTDRMSIGVQSSVVKPMSSVYKDLNYTVDTYQLRGGISVKYALVNN